jgi:hypothetical protein
VCIVILLTLNNLLINQRENRHYQIEWGPKVLHEFWLQPPNRLWHLALGFFKSTITFPVQTVVGFHFAVGKILLHISNIIFFFDCTYILTYTSMCCSWVITDQRIHIEPLRWIFFIVITFTTRKISQLVHCNLGQKMSHLWCITSHIRHRSCCWCSYWLASSTS